MSKRWEERMGFFNSLSMRIPLAVTGAILYGLLTHSIVIFLDLSSEFAIFGAVFVFLFYFGSRLLILFSGIESLYYSKGRKVISKQLYEKTSFYRTTQWVGKFYHYHDIALFIFLTMMAMIFLTTLIIDGLESKPIGNAIQNLWNALTSSGRWA